ncbi:MAG: hypothetical protein K6E20_05580, partial [Acholeplasmatales bacterium]|nr:hypothetical protein [Acholeplasmatales bacterium]
YIGINDTFKIKDDSFRIDILGPINKYKEVNSNSIVLKIKIYNTTFLYTGDMTSEEENDLILKYNDKLKSNILKVGHHGSNTSTTDEFLNMVNPDISIVSVGLNNKYNLPDESIINKLNKTSKVYETRYSGNIDIFVYKNKRYVHTYK